MEEGISVPSSLRFSRFLLNLGLKKIFSRTGLEVYGVGYNSSDGEYEGIPLREV